MSGQKGTLVELNPIDALGWIELDEGGRVRFGGTAHLLFTGMELLRRLASLVPAPRMNLTRFHGVFAPGSKLRPFLLPAAARPSEEKQPVAAAAGSCSRPQRAPRLDWAGLLRRVFKVDVFCRAKCGSRRRVLAYLTHAAPFAPSSNT